MAFGPLVHQLKRVATPAEELLAPLASINNVTTEPICEWIEPHVSNSGKDLHFAPVVAAQFAPFLRMVHNRLAQRNAL